MTTTEQWQEPTAEDKKSGHGRWKRPRTPYDIFMEEQEIPIHRDIGVHRVQDLPTKHWKKVGGNATFIQLFGTEGKWGMYVVEVPAAGALNPEKHLYEEVSWLWRAEGPLRSGGRVLTESTHLSGKKDPFSLFR